MKFAILTDIHLGPTGYYKGVLRKISKDAKRLLEHFVDEMNTTFKPAFVVVLGDLIEDTQQDDKQNLTSVLNSLRGLHCPVHFVAGNHDLKHISEDDLAEFFSQRELYYVFDSDNIHYIVLFSQVIDGRSMIPEEQMRWLVRDLHATTARCVVFVHHGLADQDLAGNPWFEGRPDNCLIANRKEIRDILRTSKKVIAVFNGHLHWNRQDMHDGIPYFTIQSLVENETDKGIASEAYAQVRILADSVRVRVKGKYPKSFSSSRT
jgi:3',5'-cyclic-AMP phosphodiesterase